ncbi:MAG: sigma-70 family RNA polymerase sigma factor, partial [Duncaniella sp.]|nr:sigma-70 family RNA polymerase sigma factor [Duncaniella sp.]
MRQNDDIQEVISEYTPRLFSYIRSQVKCREDAEDILQDVFYQLARVSADGSSEIERLSSWLYRVARNSVLNFWRKKRDVMLDTEDLVCENIATTLFCSPQESKDVFYLRRLVWE